MASVVIQINLSWASEDIKRWDDYVIGHPSSTGYHLAAWGHLVHAVFGHQPSYLMAVNKADRVCGVLPLVLLSSQLFGRFFVSLPYLNYGGVLADDSQTENLLLQHAILSARALGAEHIELRHCGAGPSWRMKDHKVSMRLTLPRSYDHLMKAFSPKLRSQVRRGEKEGMVARVAGVELLGDFYEVFARNMRDLGTPVYGVMFFRKILELFPKETRLCCVYLHDRVVAGGFLYGFRQMLEIPWASSDRRYAKMSPNMMLYGAVLRYACEQGYQVFDFGRSSKGSGTYRFKEQWGAKPVQLHWYYWLQGGDRLPELNPQNSQYRLAIEIWKRLPLPIANWLGPQVSKYLP